MLLDGMHLPLTTPFHPDGLLNLPKLRQNVARYSLTPAAGILVLGPIGEANLLSDEETKSVLQAAIEAASDAKVMLAGISRDGILPTLDLLDTASVMGYDAALVRPPSLASWNETERRIYLQTVADRSPLPLILTGDLPTHLIAELAHHPRILGYLGHFGSTEALQTLREATLAIKRSVTVTPTFTAVTGRMQSSTGPDLPSGLVSAESLASGAQAVQTVAPPARPSLKTRTKVIGFQLLTGETEHILSSLTAGAVGAVPAFSVSAPQAVYEVMAAWKDGDPALAEEKQHRVLAANKTIDRELGVAGLKYACDLNGYFGGHPRLPHLPLHATQREKVEALMQNLLLR